jgi:hypothetical protein
MCSRYWNLTAAFTCPGCASHTEDELQTHWLGVDGSCIDHYRPGEKAFELRGILSAVLDGSFDAFTGYCGECGARVRFGARIVDEAVAEIWPVSYSEPDSREDVPVTQVP